MPGEENIIAPTLSLIDHEFLLKSEGVTTSHKNSVMIIIKKVEEKANCSFLIKFRETGSFTIKIVAEYKVAQSELYDDPALLTFTGQIAIQVKKPFDIKYE
jgi:hypothetical protein